MDQKNGANALCVLQFRQSEALRDDMSKIYTTSKGSLEQRFKAQKDNGGIESLVWSKEHAIKWYADGPRCNTGSGVGVFGSGLRYSQPLGNFPSVFQVEVDIIEKSDQFNLGRTRKFPGIFPENSRKYSRMSGNIPYKREFLTETL